MRSYQKGLTNQVILKAFFIACVILFFTGCKKGKPTVSTEPVTNIQTNQATTGGKVIDDGNSNVKNRGVCWSTTLSPTISNNKTSDGSGMGSYTSTITQLTPSTLYYVRAFATNSEGTGYGNIISFTTSSVGLATVTTSPVTSITSNSAESGGNVTADGGAEVTARGVCWNTLPNPTTSNSITLDGTGTGSFTSSITGLLPGTTYYLRAYATNSVQPAYGDEITFTTLTLPTVTTNVVSSITDVTAISGGNITSTGGTDVLSRGVCWNTSQNPTIANYKTTDGGGFGAFTSNLTELTPNTLYYLRAYATNIVGTSYGYQTSFTTLLCPLTLIVTHTAGSVAPVDKTVTYGIVKTNLSGQNKCWLTQNLGADNQANSATDITESARGWFWQFNKKQGYADDGTTRIPPTTWIGPPISENGDWTADNDPCTILLGTGWRIPTQTEWINADANGGWNNYNDAYASVLKLHAAGGLNYLGGILWNTGSYGYFWSSSQYYQLPNPGGWYLGITSSTSDMYQYSKADGNSLRCIKD